MDARIVMNLAEGILEIEGSEDFVLRVYDDFKINIGVQQKEAQQTVSELAIDDDTASEQEDLVDSSPRGAIKPVLKTPKAKASKQLLRIVKELDLAAKDDIPSLVDFYKGFKAKSFFECNLIFVYYMQYIRKLDGITQGHVFTCYQAVGKRIPKAFDDSIWDTGRKKGWLETSNSSNLTVTVLGRNYIRDTMQKAE